MKVPARGVTKQGGGFENLEIERRDLQPKDVLIEIKYAGICHSDIHTVKSEWGEVDFPLVPGHEIAGIVHEVGSDVSKYKKDDRVGVGCMVDSCQECHNCKADEEQFCEKWMTGTYGSTDKYGEKTQGGYSKFIVVQEDFVLSIPDNIPLDVAAPLLCAGITTYSPLHHWNAGPGKKVAILGMGGLGHMAVKIASAMGAEVTVLSHSDDKKEDSLKFGAKEHVNTKNEEVFDEYKSHFDLIINTVGAKLDINQYLALLDVNGTLVNLGAPSEPLEVGVFSLIGGRRSFAGSLIGGIKETQEMLDFCAKHDIGPEIEVISADAKNIDDAYERVINSDVRYRFVIDIDTLK